MACSRSRQHDALVDLSDALMLGAFALGDVTSSEAAAVQAHLDGCAECRAEVAAAGGVAAAALGFGVARIVQPDEPASSERGRSLASGLG